MAGTWGRQIRSMTWEEDGLAQASADASHATLYTVTNYSGAGVLFGIGYYNNSGAAHTDGYLVITSDSNAHTWDFNSVNASCAAPWLMSGNAVMALPFYLEFDTTLLVQIANDNVGAQNIYGEVLYSILSKEIERMVIPAGQALPHRNYVESQDVMAVMIKSEYAKQGASKLIYMSSPKVVITIDPATGKVSGELKKHQWADEGVAGEDYQAGDSRLVWVPDVRDTTEVVAVGGVKYRVPIIGGKLDAGLIPNQPVDAEEIIVDLTV